MRPARFAEGRLTGPDGVVRAWPELAVLGDPVDHSLSPVLHAAALEARKIRAEYAAITVSADELSGALAAARDSGARGVNLTLPLKSAALERVRRRTEEVERIGAANTLQLRHGEWVAHNTDARGLAMALERSLGRGLRRQLGQAVIVGSGGAARAAAHALEALGARDIRILARNPERARWAESFGARVQALSGFDATTASLVVNCTPLGLDPSDESPVDTRHCPKSCFLVDLTYSDRPSRFLSDSVAPGIDGRPMLVAQAALSFAVWYGALPPLTEMAAAIGLRW